jgi:hypothetical protein
VAESAGRLAGFGTSQAVNASPTDDGLAGIGPAANQQAKVELLQVAQKVPAAAAHAEALRRVRIEER